MEKWEAIIFGTVDGVNPLSEVDGCSLPLGGEGKYQ